MKRKDMILHPLPDPEKADNETSEPRPMELPGAQAQGVQPRVLV